jgi:2-keto-4-pentenoate hydratase/2-oxohepta-3-ene-1,7-dioic acid hydratase in catechol pathway
MKIAQFYDFTDKNIYYGILKGEKIYKIEGDVFCNFIEINDFVTLDRIKILPVTLPSKIICVGLNYKDHADEVKMRLPEEPIIFLKPNSSIVGQNDYIVMPNQSKRIEYEAELAVIIKKEGKNVPLEEAKNYILGYTCANDITARDLQKKDGQWTRAKSFDTFCPLGPFIETEVDPTNLEIKLFLNKELKQHSNTEYMIFGIYYLISFISSIMTLFPGDVILTGTPPGVGQIKKGDEVIVSIEGIGELKNFIK